MSTEDSRRWDDKNWTHSRTAIVPARFQGLHEGHMDLMEGALTRFNRVVVTLDAREGTENNPFSIEQRIAWLRRAVAAKGLTQEFDIVVGTEVGDEPIGWHKNQRGVLTREDPEYTVVTCNPTVFEACDKGLAESVAVSHSPDTETRLFAGVAQPINGGGEILRKCLAAGIEPPPGYIPQGLSWQEYIEAYREMMGEIKIPT